MITCLCLTPTSLHPPRRFMFSPVSAGFQQDYSKSSELMLTKLVKGLGHGPVKNSYIYQIGAIWWTKIYTQTNRIANRARNMQQSLMCR